MRDLQEILDEHRIRFSSQGSDLAFSGHGRQVSLHITPAIIRRPPQQLAAVVRSRLGLNQRIFARNCRLSRITKAAADRFVNDHHLMGPTTHAFAYALFAREEMVAVATFSKGRKMERLPAHLRSFELIRFCCRNGISVTGGLSKLVKTFCKEKKAGDVMTYIDPKFSAGDSYLKAGFKKIIDEGGKANKHNNIKLVYRP